MVHGSVHLLAMVCLLGVVGVQVQAAAPPALRPSQRSHTNAHTNAPPAQCDGELYTTCGGPIAQFGPQCAAVGGDADKVKACLDFFFPGGNATVEKCCPCLIAYADSHSLPALLIDCQTKPSPPRPPTPPPPSPPPAPEPGCTRYTCDQKDCPVGCTNDGQCYCGGDLNGPGSCKWKQCDGLYCERDTQCYSGHCNGRTGNWTFIPTNSTLLVATKKLL